MSAEMGRLVDQKKEKRKGTIRLLMFDIAAGPFKLLRSLAINNSYRALKILYQLSHLVHHLVF